MFDVELTIQSTDIMSIIHAIHRNQLSPSSEIVPRQHSCVRVTIVSAYDTYEHPGLQR
jgi:hypothetical protein